MTDHTSQMTPPVAPSGNGSEPCAAGDIPVLGGVVPSLTVSGAAAATAFYVRAFGAEEMGRAPPDEEGRLMHVHLYVNGGSLMLCDPFPEHGHPAVAHQGYMLHLQVDDVDPAWARALEAGCSIVMPVQRMFWGHRYGVLRDPFGVTWSIASIA